MGSAPLIFPANIAPANLQQISHLTSYYFDFVTKSEQAGKTGEFGASASLGSRPLRLPNTSRFQNAANCDFVSLDILVSNAPTEAPTFISPRWNRESVFAGKRWSTDRIRPRSIFAVRR
jgi:hypothetical protein